MIKFLVTLLFFFSGLSLAAEPIVITHAAGKTSVAETEMMNLSKKLDEQKVNVKFTSTGQCEDAIKLWNSTTTGPTIMWYSTSTDRLEATKGKPCTANLAKARFVMVRKSQVWLCSGATSKPFTTPDLRVGTQTVMPGEDLVADINKSNNYSWKPIPIKATGDGLIALANGDLDYYFITRPGIGDRVAKGEIKCVGSSNRDDTVPYLGTLFKANGDLYSALTVMPVVITKNLTDDQFQKVQDYFDPKKNDEYLKHLEFDDIKLEKIDPNMTEVFLNHAKKSRTFYKK
jgi:hypothetical protein